MLLKLLSLQRIRPGYLTQDVVLIFIEIWRYFTIVGDSREGEMDLQMGNRVKVVALAIGRVDLKLPSGMVVSFE